MANKQMPAIGRNIFKLLIDLFNGSHAEAILSLEGAVIASDGNVIHIPSLPKTYGRDSAGNITYIAVTNWTGIQYKRTFTLTASLVSAESGWVKQ